MESTRQNKIARLVQKNLGEIFRVQSTNIFDGAMITVTKTYVTKDLSIARVYVSIFCKNDNVKKNEIFEKILLNKSYLRKLLGINIGKQVRLIPELEFFIDDSLDYIENIERLLKK
ncbi:MAG TPA: ribosome-binding factor A [Bacteroidales bacterium]|nr:ribosome-binding factor A [Bacteroidales bacterium]